VHDVHAPTVGAAIRLARLIAETWDVEIVGPDLGHGVCSMYREAFPIKAVQCPRLYRFPDYFFELRKLLKAVSGDVVVAFKAYADTVSLALKYRRKTGAWVIACLDEWDGALWHGMDAWEKAGHLARHLYHPLSEWCAPRVERQLVRCDQVVSSTTFLQKKFGGQVLPMGVDCSFFKPQPESVTQKLRRQWGLTDKVIIGFGGVVRPHKGIEPYLDAVAGINDVDVRFAVFGPRTQYLESLIQRPAYRDRILCIGVAEHETSDLNSQVHRHMPAYLGMADMLVVSLADTLLARSQMPIKVFEAMAMARPILAADVSDLPDILEGCGWINTPADVSGIRSSIQAILEQPREASRRAQRAREKCIKRYDAEIVRGQWIDMLAAVSSEQKRIPA
jgi:glycosyltransferase involved in cell wall biosynthesis